MLRMTHATGSWSAIFLTTKDPTQESSGNNKPWSEVIRGETLRMDSWPSREVRIPMFHDWDLSGLCGIVCCLRFRTVVDPCLPSASVSVGILSGRRRFQSLNPFLARVIMLIRLLIITIIIIIKKKQ